MSEHHPPRVRSASPRVRLLGNHSRRAKSPSVNPFLEAYRRDVERTIRRDPTSLSVPIVTPRGRSPERATTTETQRDLTDYDFYQEQYSILCERLRASESDLIDTAHRLREAKHRLKITDYIIQHGAEGHTQSKDEASAREYPATQGSQVSMQGEHTHHDQNQTRAINNTNGRLGDPDGYTRHRQAQLRTPLSAPTQVSPPRNMGFERNYETDEHDSNSSQSMSPYYVARATIEQAQRKREDIQHNGGARSELGAEGYPTEGSDSTMDSTVGMRGSVVSITELDSVDSNDSAWRSTAETRGGEDNNPSNERASPAGSSYISYASDWTLVSRPSQSYPKSPQHWPNTASASGSTSTSLPSAPGNLGVTRRSMRLSLSPLQCPPNSTDPSIFTSLSFSRVELELAIRWNVARNMDLIPCTPASASPPVNFQLNCYPSLYHDPTPNIRRQPAPDTPITAHMYPRCNWNTANSRTWIYQNLITRFGFSKSDAYNITMGWMGDGMTLIRMSPFDWQVLISSYYAGWLNHRRLY
ncbi:uncharacterized protein Bfra_001848 [Botrytis fragariae]|uniref:Uncharacterized protein n=1 Tax=Botrytis fragariae TaxID=1964551 RepID=A0A8H6B146_9HELO|nr:uncharacterized protein Bfra_001848 [Botrytis fragariae]KAF5877481.1 hypothetical protein Bfra_001848 [Botrytis fragariae]